MGSVVDIGVVVHGVGSVVLSSVVVISVVVDGRDDLVSSVTGAIVVVSSTGGFVVMRMVVGTGVVGVDTVVVALGVVVLESKKNIFIYFKFINNVRHM